MTVPEPTKRTRVVAVAEPGSTAQQISTALNTQADFVLADLVSALDKAPQLIRAAQAEIILVDHTLGGQPTIDALDDLALQFPQAAVVAILPDGDAVRVQQVILAGARGFLVQPFTQVNLLSTLRRVRDLEARRKYLPGSTAVAEGTAEDLKPPRMLAVFGPRGGVGTSTLAINLAIALKEETDQRVLLLEGKMLFGHLGVMLNLVARNTLSDLIPHAHALEESLVRDVVSEHASGIHVLLAPNSPEAGQGIRPETLFGVVDGLRRLFDYLVIDAGSSLNENTVTLLDLAQRVLLVATPDLAALHDVSRFILISRTLAYKPGKVLTVLNRAGLLGGVRVSDIQTALHQELFAQVPDDAGNALRSINRGVPLLLKYPRSPASRGIQRLAKALLKVRAASAVQAAAPARRMSILGARKPQAETPRS
jgi:pilus assembly protein CpaE